MNDDDTLAAHRQGIETLRIGYNRYQIARRMNIAEWGDIRHRAYVTGKTIDELIDIRIKNELDKETK